MNIVKLDEVKDLYTDLVYRDGKPYLIPMKLFCEKHAREFLTTTDQVFTEDTVKSVTEHMHRSLPEIYIEGNIYTIGRLINLLVREKYDVFDLIGAGQAINLYDSES